MDEAIRNAAVFGGLALACGSLGWWPRWGAWAAAALALGAWIAALWMGVTPAADLMVLRGALPAEPLLLLAGWGLLALGLRRLDAAGGFGPSALGAFLGGAAFGALPVALALASRRSPRAAARCGLAAVAGGLCGPLGSAPLLLLVEPGVLPALWPLGSALGLLAALPLPGEPRPVPGPSSRLLWLAAPPLWLLAVLCSSALALLAGLALVWGLVLWRRPAGLVPALEPSLRLLALLACVLLLLPAGLLDYIAWGLEDAQLLLGGLLEMGFGLAGLLLGVLAGGAPLALVAVLTFAADPGLFGTELRAVLVAGAAVGAALPLMAMAGRGVLRAGLGRWALAVLVLLVWLGLRVWWG
jgi:hypothetical protein